VPTASVGTPGVEASVGPLGVSETVHVDQAPSLVPANTWACVDPG
jgi:hypothetical protein